MTSLDEYLKNLILVLMLKGPDLHSKLCMLKENIEKYTEDSRSKIALSIIDKELGNPTEPSEIVDENRKGKGFGITNTFYGF